MEKICIYQNPNSEWIFQNLSKNNSQSFRSLKALVKNVFRNYLEWLKIRVNDQYAPYKEYQLHGYIKAIIKDFGVCWIDFPGNLETGVIDESLNILSTHTGFIFHLNKKVIN